jgi:transposase
VIVRYRYRVYPGPHQEMMLARTFGCARVVFNDALRVRDAAHAAGEKISDTEVPERHGRAVVKVGRWFPSSQICSACGIKDGPKPLGVRQWTCGGCGTAHDRDVNAARNTRLEGRKAAAGQADAQNACGGTVRPGLVPAGPGETGTRRSAA